VNALEASTRIPAVSEWGMVVLVILVLAAGPWSSGGRGTQSARVVQLRAQFADWQLPIADCRLSIGNCQLEI